MSKDQHPFLFLPYAYPSTKATIFTCIKIKLQYSALKDPKKKLVLSKSLNPLILTPWGCNTSIVLSVMHI